MSKRERIGVIIRFLCLYAAVMLALFSLWAMRLGQGSNWWLVGFFVGLGVAMVLGRTLPDRIP